MQLHCPRTLAALVAAGMLCLASPARGQAPSLGSAADFAVLGASTVTNTGLSVITGNLGVSPGTAITGFPPGSVAGTTHAGDSAAALAQTDVTTAYNILAGLPCGTNLTGQDLGGLTLTPGVYCFASSAQLTGTLNLNAQGDANAVFIFQIGSTLTTASNAAGLVINGGDNCNVFWQVGSSATLGLGTTLPGNILAAASVTATTGSRVFGRVFARSGAVTLDTNDVAVCAPLEPVCPTITVNPATVLGGTVGVAYTQTVTGSGGVAPYAFGITAGTLPGGLSLTSAGVLAGTPTTAGSFSFTVRGTDANGCFGDRAYSVVIVAAPPPPPVCPTITVNPDTVIGATLGVAYAQTLTGSGGVAPYLFGISAGALPAGLTLTSAGVVAGTPTAAAPFTFMVRGTDADGCFGERAYSVTVVAAVPMLSSWATAALAILLALGGLAALRKRAR